RGIERHAATVPRLANEPALAYAMPPERPSPWHPRRSATRHIRKVVRRVRYDGVHAPVRERQVPRIAEKNERAAHLTGLPMPSRSSSAAAGCSSTTLSVSAAAARLSTASTAAT